MIFDGIPGMPETGESKKHEQYNRISLDLGHGEQSPDPGSRGGIFHISQLVPAKLSAGPVGYGAHSADEHMELASLPMQTARTALLIYRLPL